VPLLDLQNQWVSSSTPGNNGNLRGQTIQSNDGLAVQQTFEYDNLNRLTSITESSGSALNQRTFACDRFANMLGVRKYWTQLG
jgi:YD repeat-containing protein